MGAVCSQHGNCAIPDENMLQFTTWDKKQVGEMLERYRRSLYSSFALNVEQTQVLLDDSKVRGGRESVNDQLNTLQTCLIFKNILDTDQNNLIDGYETVSVVIMLSSLTTSEKLDRKSRELPTDLCLTSIRDLSAVQLRKKRLFILRRDCRIAANHRIWSS